MTHKRYAAAMLLAAVAAGLLFAQPAAAQTPGGMLRVYNSSNLPSDAEALFDAYHEGLPGREWLKTHFAKADLIHPAHALAAGEIETARCHKKHIQARQEAADCVSAVVVYQALVDDKRPAAR